jgi:hypothetical protein
MVEEVLDSILRIRDLLREAIPTLIREIKGSALLVLDGDGGSVVAVKKSKGIQESIGDRSRACATLCSPFRINSPPKGLRSLSLISRRRMSSKPIVKNSGITSKPLANLDIFVKALNQIKRNKGANTPGVDKETLDGMSKEKLIILQKAILE